ncbi:cytochrome c biogenesis C [Cucumis melo var. makuwa]|uniref:Cytochrome c biogenesis C n=1 Tax=Cucumis melo var. makuwa TaxID=1194695 RepID=A0A5D3BVQ6_CUCMM|nr:cytochrome c biogenesis C [Cucumis melo var. makuwa]
MGAFFTLLTLVTRGFQARPMWGTFWVWDAHLTYVFISFLIYLGALRFQKLPVELASISIRLGPIDIPIIKFSANWWNTSHQPRSISGSSTSIHVPMPIPILSNFANFPLETHIFFVLETQAIPSRSTIGISNRKNEETLFPYSHQSLNEQTADATPFPSALGPTLIHSSRPDELLCAYRFFAPLSLSFYKIIQHKNERATWENEDRIQL